MLEMDRLVAEAVVLAGGAHQCAALGHIWKFSGGAACCCENVSPLCTCSIPVNECESCGLIDYGDNEEAREIKRECSHARELKGESDD